jgi:hypothetical protein
MADLFVAAARAMAGDLAGMERTIAAATARPHASTEFVGGVSLVRALPHLLSHDLAAATGLLDAAVAALGADDASAPGAVWGLWALLRTVVDDRGQEARERLRSSAPTVIAANRGGLQYADAMAAGRMGRREVADALMSAADQTLAGQHWWRRLLRLPALEAAVADGWGSPVAGLRVDLEAFERAGEDGFARTCRDLLRRAGAPVRRGRGTSVVPADLHGPGVTTRETDVLVLLARG